MILIGSDAIATSLVPVIAGLALISAAVWQILRARRKQRSPQGARTTAQPDARGAGAAEARGMTSQDWRILAGLLILAILAIVFLWGPYVAGYHRGESLTDSLSGAHCIRWINHAVWCRQ